MSKLNRCGEQIYSMLKQAVDRKKSWGDLYGSPQRILGSMVLDFISSLSASECSRIYLLASSRSRYRWQELDPGCSFRPR